MRAIVTEASQLVKVWKQKRSVLLRGMSEQPRFCDKTLILPPQRGINMSSPLPSIGLSIIVLICLVAPAAGCKDDGYKTPTRRASYTPVRSTSSETDADKLRRLTRESSSLVRWIESNVDPLARCVAADKIDWSLYGTRLQLFATILSESGKDAMDGRLDSYSTYEIERNINGAQQTVRELKQKCGIR